MNTKTTKRSTLKHSVLGLFALFALICAVILGSNTANAAITTVQVGQTNGGATSANQYNAAAITVATGDTVRWVRFAGSHNVVSVTPGLIDLPPGAVAAGDAMVGGVNYDFTFATAGTYYYYCNIHANAGDATDANVASGSKMVGKVVVLAPVLDSAPPTVSAVAAAPSPTDGAGAVTLTATITDTAQAGSTQAASVTAAEWSKGASAAASGAGTAMAAADGTFGSATEGVTATVPVTEAAGTSFTLWVRGKDANNNWSTTAVSTVVSVTAPPAGAVQASVSVSGGNLANTAQNVTFPGVTLNGTDQTVAGSTAPAWAASDARGSGLGWNVTIISTAFTGAGGTIPVANFKIRLLTVTTISGNTAPTPGPGSYTSLSSVSLSAIKLLTAAVGTGMGSYTYTPDFQLTVPGSAGAGSYTANVEVSVNSGP